MKIAGTGIVLLGTGGYVYLNDEDMKPAPERDGKVLCDLHTHPPNDSPLDELVSFLGSPGMIGLSQRYGEDGILTYERARELLGSRSDFQELTIGKLARFREGYFARTQEVLGVIHHFLALGWNGDYLSDKETPQEAIDAIHEKDGVVIFNHPYSVPGGFGFRVANEEEEERIKKLLSEVEEVEVHNAFNIDYLGIGMKQANRLALQLVQREGRHKGTASSDCRRTFEQAKICGIYVDRDVIDTQGMDGLKKAIVDGNFERYGNPDKGPYISRLSFTTRLALPRIEMLLGI